VQGYVDAHNVCPHKMTDGDHNRFNPLLTFTALQCRPQPSTIPHNTDSATSGNSHFCLCCYYYYVTVVTEAFPKCMQSKSVKDGLNVSATPIEGVTSASCAHTQAYSSV